MFVVKKETLENKEELKNGLETLKFKNKEEPLCDIKPKFEVKNENQAFQNGLEAMEDIGGTEIKTKETFENKQVGDELKNGLEILETAT